jgi:hypothetical protein
MDFLFTYHPIWILLALGLAFLYSFFLYRKDLLLEEVSPAIKRVLAIFRFTTIFVIAILLLGIILENFKERKDKPIVFVVNDNSASILQTKDSVFYRTKFNQDLNDLSNQLSEQYTVLNYSFGENLNPNFSQSYTDKLTDISNVFDEIFDAYSNRNIGSIILATDGIYNSGANPIYAVARKSYLPIYTIGLGDTSIVKDVQIDKILHNDIAFLGNEFPVQINFSHARCNSEPITIAIYEGDKLLSKENITLKGNEQQGSVNFKIQANRVGFRKYTAKISAVDGEYSLVNNTANFYVEVIDGRQKILIAQNGPHPDVAAIRYIIENNKNYEVEVKRITEIASVSNYDLVIVHNYQDKNPILTEAIATSKLPFLFMVGANADIKKMGELKIGFSGISRATEEVRFAANPQFNDILIDQKTNQTFHSCPPLTVPFTGLNYSKALSIMAYQKVGSVQLDQPLIYFTQKDQNRIGVIMGEGIWRWRLFDQLKNNSTENFETFFGKIITYLAVKENKDPFRVQLNKEYLENENVLIKAEFYNKSFELLNEAEVAFNYENADGDLFESFFIRTTNAYQLDLGKLPQGVYSWNAQTIVQGETFKKSGTFIVRELKVEWLNTVADHRLLRNISDASGGKFFFPNELNKLEVDLLSREDIVTVVYQEKSFDDLIDYKWIFFLIILLVSAEWFIRKYNGAY